MPISYPRPTGPDDRYDAYSIAGGVPAKVLRDRRAVS